jgi:A/G-specific adenine glycosylase
MKLTIAEKKKFQQTVWDFYYEHGRHNLPWRQTTDPYYILVSELMLQQTQVDRVIPKYNAFIERWPTSELLAQASLGDVLKAWQGLGYNRRAKYLLATVTHVEEKYDGVFPRSEIELQLLPGIGPYTASAVAAFSYDQPVVLIETNVRQVVIFHFFADKEVVSDSEIYELVAATLPDADFRNWYAALMDYGSHLKRMHGNLARKSKSYTKQSTFKGSDREVRGAILRLLSIQTATEKKMLEVLDMNPEKIKIQLTKLLAEGLVVKNRSTYALP